MLTRTLLATIVLAAAVQADEPKAGNAGGKSPALEPFKQLAGDWVGKEVKGMNPGKEVRANYKITSAGTAVVETLFPGGDHEMVTVIHPDGADLVLTHYCALGNQPQMKASGKLDGNKVAFKFVRATNMKNDSDPHMHDVTFTFLDKDTYQAEWTYFKDGKAAGTVVFEMHRKK